MRVLIDATSLLLRSAGIKTYTWHWIRSLRQQAGPSDEIATFPFLNGLGDLRHDASVLSAASTLPRLGLLYFLNLPGNPAIDWAVRGADLFHASNQVRNPPRKTRLTATLHDLTCWLMPELHTAGNVRADHAFAEHVLKRATGLIAVSENTRADAIRLLGIPPERIQVIYSGIPDAFFDAQPTAAPKPYVLYLGAIEPRKNVDTLLDAWTSFALHDEFDLVIAGAPGWSAARILARLESGIRGVRYLGYVPESELPGLTAGATAFVYPSLYEGFGFPVAQAMAAGVPVVTSNTSCLPEITGDAALLVDPRSPAEISAALEKLLTSPTLRTTLAEAGRVRAERYRWDRCAADSLEFFRQYVS
jgi:glycosyltransferase involved in cell wall biosynthesis